MNKENLRILIVSIYGLMQTELDAVKLLSDNGAPKKSKHHDLIEEESLKIYHWLASKIVHLKDQELVFYAKKFNKIVESLVNEENLVNNYLMALMLLRNYFDEVANKPEQIIYKHKVARQIKVYEDVFSKDKEEYKGIQKVTSRVADNIWRVLNDQLQLSDEVRDARAKRFLK